MTIKKSQGQSFKVVGLDLETKCYDQLYVGCSRARKETNYIYRPKIFIYILKSYMKNIYVL